MKNSDRTAENDTLKQLCDRQIRMMLHLEVVLGVITVVAFLLMIFIGVSALSGDPIEIVMPKGLAIALIAVGSIILVVGTTACLVIEQKAGWYRCSKCGKTYIPSLRSVTLAPHINRTRMMNCPHCGRRCWAKKTISNN